MALLSAYQLLQDVRSEYGKRANIVSFLGQEDALGHEKPLTTPVTVYTSVPITIKRRRFPPPSGVEKGQETLETYDATMNPVTDLGVSITLSKDYRLVIDGYNYLILNFRKEPYGFWLLLGRE
jgi:hypothetical protein